MREYKDDSCILCSRHLQLSWRHIHAHKYILLLKHNKYVNLLIYKPLKQTVNKSLFFSIFFLTHFLVPFIVLLGSDLQLNSL